MKESNPAGVMRSILLLGTFVGLCPKQTELKVPMKQERVMAEAGDDGSEDACAPPSWEQCFSPHQEPAGRGAAGG